MIVLPFPPASLSGHNSGSWRGKSATVKHYRDGAHWATLASRPQVPDAGDIPIRFTFYPPDNRGDRCNYPNRLKPQIDGIAKALGVNDKRFLPDYVFAEISPPGRVEVEICPR